MTRVVFRVASERTPRERKATLLTNADIQGWIKDHRRPSTTRAQLEQLELFCRRSGLDPDILTKIAAERPNKTFPSRALDRVGTERRAGRPQLYIKTSWYAVKTGALRTGWIGWK